MAYADGALFHDEVSSFLFYGIPVALAGWRIGRFAALVFSVLAAATWLWVNTSRSFRRYRLLRISIKISAERYCSLVIRV